LSSKKSQFEAGFFLIANIVAGVIHYLFQVIGVKRLDPDVFGQVMGWMAYAALGFSLGLLAQSLANFFPQSPKALRWQSLVLFGLGLVITFISLTHELTAFQHGLIGIIMFGAFGWLNGQTQTQKMFWIMGFVGLAIAFLKLSLVVLPTQVTAEHFYWGYTLNAIIGLGLLALTFTFRKKNTSFAPELNIRDGVLAATVLAFVTMFIPQFDILFVAQTQSRQVTGEFAQVALIYRGIFFFILIFAQWLLPNQIQGKKSSLSRKEENQRIAMALGGGVVLAAIAALLGPPIANIILGISLGTHPWWIFYSTIHVSILTILFLRIQKDCASLKVKSAVFQTIVMTLVLSSMILLKPDVTTYLMIVCTAHFILLAGVLVRGADRS
jgi:hypothetical protein